MKRFLVILFSTGIVLFNACQKDIFEPSLDGTWIEIDSISTQNPTGCKLVINGEEGEVSLCGFPVVHPHNVVTLTTKKRARLYMKDGQMWYRQKRSDILWVAPIARQDLYFMDYDFEGKFLWVIGDDSETKVTARNHGKLFMKQ